jgi:uncharacterized protein YbjT (DUF2867 family)
MTDTVLVTGASGFVGSNLCVALADAGYDVRAMTRHPDKYTGAGTPVAGDVQDASSLAAALTGVTTAYYLVHSLASKDFEQKDAEAARNFSRAAAQAGVDQIVYLGGLGSDRDDLSKHLRSRREVERILGSDGVPVTVLRAAVVIGHGGISWEITRQLVDHLPAMITPKWTKTRVQPIALADVIRYLVGVLGNPQAIGRVFEIGGPEVLSYVDMMKRAAAVRGKPLPSIDVPLLSPGLSSGWLALVTDVDLATARNLVDSMSNEVVVTEHTIQAVVPGEPIGYDESVRLAIAERKRAAGS